MKICVKAFIFLVFITTSKSANILFLHLFSPSHHIWNRALAKGLALAGHNATFLSVDPPAEEVENLHYIFLKGSREKFWEGSEKTRLIELSKEADKNKFKAALFIAD